MVYYLVLSDEMVENSKDLFTNQYELARTSFETAYPLQGFSLFERLLDENKIGQMEIYNEEGEEIGIESFVEKLEDYNLKQ